jgi:endoglucanase
MRARGTCGGERIGLFQGTQLLHDWYLSKDFTEYTFSSFSGSSNLSLQFINNSLVNGCDRNVQIDKIRIGNTLYEAESFPNRLLEGDRTACVMPNERTEWLYCNASVELGSK